MICFLRITLLLPRRRPLADAVTISDSSGFASSGAGAGGSSSIGSSAGSSSAIAAASSSSSSSSIIRRSASSRSFRVIRPEVPVGFGSGISESSSPSSDKGCALESSPLGVAGREATASFLALVVALEKACIIPELALRFSGGTGFLVAVDDAFSALSWAGWAGFGSSLTLDGAGVGAVLKGAGFACAFTVAVAAAAAFTPMPFRSRRRTRGLVITARFV